MSITYENENVNLKIENFSDFTEKVFDAMMELGKTIIQKQLESLDDELMQLRDSKRYRNKGSRKTAIKTKLGTIEYTRRIYFDTTTKKHIFLLDKTAFSQTIGLFDESICKSIERMICNQSFREVANSISENTGLDITHQSVWKIVQKIGQNQIDICEEAPKTGEIESKILYEEADGDWLPLQGKDRTEHGKSKEMKIGIAYDGVIYHNQENGKIRRELDNKVAYASFDSASDFRKNKEKVIASVYNTDEITLRVKNGDGANWIQKDTDCDCISVLDKFHRNKKITECVSDKNIAENLYNLLLDNKFGELLECIEAYENSIEDEHEKAKLRELYSYYSENYNALSDYRDRGKGIPPTREPGVIHHARLGSMEGNVFTIIGNRMKGRRACWSIKGGNRLAALLCKYYSVSYPDKKAEAVVEAPETPPLSASKAPKTDGKGYEFAKNVSIPPELKCLKQLSLFKPLSELKF